MPNDSSPAGRGDGSDGLGRRPIRVKNLVLALAGLAVAAVPLPAAAQAVQECTVGQQVTDDHGKEGVIAAAHGDQCLIKYNDGKTQGWVAPQTLHATAPGKSDAPPPGKPPALGANPLSVNPPPKNGADAVAILRPTVNNRLVYHADQRGHVVLTAEANGAPVRFMVDTGASLVVLTPDDARAAGITRSELVFDHLVQTGNGTVRAALVRLREIGIGGLSMQKVQAAVIESIGQSVLGMSFLGRLKGFEMREGVLTVEW
jgi:clan AA aspartic protease (TIGR02281 family)